MGRQNFFLLPAISHIFEFVLIFPLIIFNTKRNRTLSENRVNVYLFPYKKVLVSRFIFKAYEIPFSLLRVSIVSIATFRLQISLVI